MLSESFYTMLSHTHLLDLQNDKPVTAAFLSLCCSTKWHCWGTINSSLMCVCVGGGGSANLVYIYVCVLV